ncbi:pantetheine-phosphate adenylyltransferase [Alkalicoccus urumqiensis]|uniref:Phosphopantetheine adenylyltransferase n=1 Tax=Alkalicoccus urumqiensis TaxID=1548213 RepID=A0A2P6MEN5_ALKUR|nr:pantetheine-phosphate adenylyltransferase [Alkalicoccus urumqiensis]PRO64744.1 pantetheine-phosphate adenylyltransferase [Alkalicoccus urumqiensis]
MHAFIPGSYDPVTNGHMDIISRSAGLFQAVTVAVLHNSRKQPLFSLEEKTALLEEACALYPNVRVAAFDGLLTKAVKEAGADVLVKGIRSVTDMEYEEPMAVMNRKLTPSVETLYMPGAPEYQALSSTLVKEIARHGALTDDMVPEAVKAALEKKFSS